METHRDNKVMLSLAFFKIMAQCLNVIIAMDNGQPFQIYQTTSNDCKQFIATSVLQNQHQKMTV